MPDGSNTAGLILDDREDGIFRVHRSVFVDREIFERERARIFDRSWLFAGHVSEFPNPGDFVTRSVGGAVTGCRVRPSDCIQCEKNRSCV